MAERDPERLARYWDALVAQGAAPPPDAAEIDPALAEAIAQFQTAADVAGPDPAFVARLRTELLGGAAPPAAATARRPHRAVHPPSLTAVPNGRAAPRATRWPPLAAEPGHRRWFLGRLAVAALLALTLAAGLLALRIVRPGWVFQPTIVPVVETLLDATVEVEGAAGGWVPFGVERWTFQPGSAVLRVPPVAGPQWVVVDGGSLLATVDGVERPLATADALVVPAGQELVLRNAGATEAAIYRSVATTGFVFEDYDPSAISRQPVLETLATLALPTGSSRVVFARLTVAPEGALPPQTTGELDWFGVIAGRLGMTPAGDKLPVGWRDGVEREIRAFEQWARLVPGTELTMRNLGEEPLVLLRLTVVPQAAGGQAAATREPVTATG